MRIRLSLLGCELFCLSVGEETEDGDQWSGCSHTGALIERDLTPLDPDDHYGDWEFGFRDPK